MRCFRPTPPPFSYGLHQIDTKLERAWFDLYLRLTWVDPVLANALLDRTHRATATEWYAYMSRDFTATKFKVQFTNGLVVNKVQGGERDAFRVLEVS